MRPATTAEQLQLVGGIPSPATRQAMQRARETGLLHLPYDVIKDWALAIELDFLDGTEAVTFNIEKE